MSGNAPIINSKKPNLSKNAWPGLVYNSQISKPNVRLDPKKTISNNMKQTNIFASSSRIPSSPLQDYQTIVKVEGSLM